MREAKTYSEKLRDPRWQKRSAEIKELADWTCKRCLGKMKTLSAHHIYYETGRDPWDYTDRELECLCDECHKDLEHWLTETRKALHNFPIGLIRALALILMFESDSSEFMCELASWLCSRGTKANLVTAIELTRNSKDRGEAVMAFLRQSIHTPDEIDSLTK